MSEKSLLLLDGNALMHRAYYGIGKGQFVPVLDDQPVGMVYGFASTLLHAMNHFRPDQIIVTFDTKAKTFRHEMDEDYKAQREKAPDEFYAQIPYVYQMLEAFGVPTLAQDGYESDDLIGTLSTRAEEEGFESVVILSGDLDFLQLVNDRVKLAKFNGKMENSIIYGPVETEARYGIRPEQMVDFKAITGDSSDNYKGIQGIGPKTAATLLQKYKTLNGIYKHLDELPDKIREKFEEQKEYVYHCQKLAQIHTQCPVEQSLADSFTLDENGAQKFLEKMRFPSLVQRLHKTVRQQENPRTPLPTQSKETEEEQLSLF